MLLLAIMMVTSCATLNLNVNKTPYDQALSFFNDAWKSYHKVWILLPEVEKKEWVAKYHTKFKKAGDLLQSWASTPGDSTILVAWEITKDELQNILIELAIKDRR